MIGTGLALLASGLASGVGGAISAKKQATAAKKAAEQQVNSTNEARGYVQQGLGQLGQLYSPYINSGAGAIGTLGRLTTPGPGARFASPGPPNAMPQTPGYGAPPNQAVPRGGMPPPGYGGQPGYGGTFAQMRPQGSPQQMRMPPPGYYQY